MLLPVTNVVPLLFGRLPHPKAPYLGELGIGGTIRRDQQQSATSWATSLLPESEIPSAVRALVTPRSESHDSLPEMLVAYSAPLCPDKLIKPFKSCMNRDSARLLAHNPISYELLIRKTWCPIGMILGECSPRRQRRHDVPPFICRDSISRTVNSSPPYSSPQSMTTSANRTSSFQYFPGRVSDS